MDLFDALPHLGSSRGLATGLTIGWRRSQRPDIVHPRRAPPGAPPTNRRLLLHSYSAGLLTVKRQLPGPATPFTRAELGCELAHDRDSSGTIKLWAHRSQRGYSELIHALRQAPVGAPVSGHPPNLAPLTKLGRPNPVPDTLANFSRVPLATAGRKRPVAATIYCLRAPPENAPTNKDAGTQGRCADWHRLGSAKITGR